MAGVAERIIPIGSKSSIYSMVIMALNQRLGSNCTTLNCIYSIIDPQNRTLCEVATIPEQDAWRYDGNYSMVCDGTQSPPDECKSFGPTIDSLRFSRSVCLRDVQERRHLWQLDQQLPVHRANAQGHVPVADLGCQLAPSAGVHRARPAAPLLPAHGQMYVPLVLSCFRLLVLTVPITDVLSLPGYNSLAPYANMNNYCPSVPPVYYRPAVC